MERPAIVTTAPQATTTTTTTTTTTAGSSSSTSSSTEEVVSGASTVIRVVSELFVPDLTNASWEGTESIVPGTNVDEARRRSRSPSPSVSASFGDQSNSPTELEGLPPPPYEMVQVTGSEESSFLRREEHFTGRPPTYEDAVLMGGEQNPFQSPPVRSSRRRSRFTAFCSRNPFGICGAWMIIAVIISWAAVLFFMFLHILQCIAADQHSSTDFLPCTFAQKILYGMTVGVICFSIGCFCFKFQNTSLRKTLCQLLYGIANLVACCTLLIADMLMSNSSSFNITQNASNVAIQTSHLRSVRISLGIWMVVLFLFVCRSYFRVLDVARR